LLSSPGVNAVQRRDPLKVSGLTSAAVAKLSVVQIDAMAMIRATSFHEAKAAQIHEMARADVR
jgi:endonuclease III